MPSLGYNGEDSFVNLNKNPSSAIIRNSVHKKKKKSEIVYIIRTRGVNEPRKSVFRSGTVREKAATPPYRTFHKKTANLRPLFCFFPPVYAMISRSDFIFPFFFFIFLTSRCCLFRHDEAFLFTKKTRSDGAGVGIEHNIKSENKSKNRVPKRNIVPLLPFRRHSFVILGFLSLFFFFFSAPTSDLATTDIR